MTRTSVPVKLETLRRLRGYKTTGETFDAVLNALMDAQPPERFVREHLRRLRHEERVTWASVRRRSNL